jgi:Zn2+/Cd2+-exporting ATPase
MTTESEVLLSRAGDPDGCLYCAERVASRLRVLPGIQTVSIDPTPLRLRYAYDTESLSPAEIADLVEREMSATESRYHHRVLAIEGMDCADCARTLERGVGRMAGVEYADVNFGAARLTVEYDSQTTDLPAIHRKVSELGYAVSQPAAAPETERGALWRLVSRRDNALALLSGLFTLTGVIMMLAGAPGIASTSSYALAVLVGGLPLARKGLRALQATHSLDINLLMSLAVVGAVAIGDYLEAATVVFLFSLGEALEGYAMDRVRRSVRSLLSLAPATALVKRGTAELALPVAEVLTGDLVVVRAGERVPLDGVVAVGASEVDQSSLTGESLPVAKAEGDALFAGTMNGSGPLTMRVTRLAGDASVARIIRLVETAQAQRAPAQQLVDRFARVYTPAVVIGALLVASVPPLLGGDWIEWLSRALVLLVISCPCALVLSTPISIVSALSAAARHGVLIKGGAILERAGMLDTVAFDKTGTLTLGRPRVTSIHPLAGQTEGDVLRIAASLERHSEHPLGQAILDAAVDRQISIDEAIDERVVHGAGLIATLGGVGYRIGSTRLFEDSAITETVSTVITQIEEIGGTAVLVGQGNHILGVLGLTDTPRPEARAALDALRRTGVERVVMLSGDRTAAARDIAAGFGIPAADTRAELLPEDKLTAIGELRAAGGTVAMVGDGVNDAPALAAADIGIAMGVAGTDAAVETADIALMGDDLNGLAAAIRLGRRARRIIAANITFSIATKLVFLTLAVTGQATLWMAIAADVGVSLLVIANGLRLMRWRG